MQVRHFTIAGSPSVLVGTSKQIATRTDFALEAEARDFAERLRVAGFEPRTLDNDGSWIVTLQTTPAEVIRLLKVRA